MRLALKQLQLVGGGGAGLQWTHNVYTVPHGVQHTPALCNCDFAVCQDAQHRLAFEAWVFPCGNMLPCLLVQRRDHVATEPLLCANSVR